MLKTDLKIILSVILLLQYDLNKVISYVVAILAGLCISTGYEIQKGTLSKKTFGIRVLFIAGLCPTVYYIWSNNTVPFIDDVMAMFFSALFSDFIVTFGYKIFPIWLRQTVSNWLNIKKDE